MSTELTPTGLKAQTFAEVRQELVDAFRAVYGPINTGEESAIGQQITIMAEREAIMVQALQAVYASQYPASAAGRSLDGVVQLTGITRREATRTIVDVVLTGSPNVTIPKDSAASTDNDDIFSLTDDVTLDANGEGTGQMIAKEAGPVIAPPDTLTNIETPVSGWDQVTNPQEGVTGRPVESDSELRLRRVRSLQVTGSATVGAIRSRLLEQVDDVTAATIIENRTGEVDAQGRPPHSFEAVVTGGTDADIAQNLFETKAAGIETTGTITEIVTDSTGKEQVIKFSRPIPRFIWVRLTLTALNGISESSEQAAKEAVVEKGEQLQLGDDVIWQTFVGRVHRAVDNLDEVFFEIGVSSDPETEPSTFEQANIAIENNEQAQFDVDRVEVIT